MAEKLGKKQQFITSPEGIKSRYTDKETSEIFTMVMSGLLAKQIVLTLQKNGINSVSLTGIDGALLRAARKKKLIVVDDRGRKIAIDGGYTGKINEINTQFLELLLSQGVVLFLSHCDKSPVFRVEYLQASRGEGGCNDTNARRLADLAA